MNINQNVEVSETRMKEIADFADERSCDIDDVFNAIIEVGFHVLMEKSDRGVESTIAYAKYRKRLNEIEEKYGE